MLLAFIAGLVAQPLLWRGESTALAQTSPLVGARGVYAFSGKLGANRDGIFMLDIEQGTLWCYELEASATGPKLRLVAARSWVYDRYLRDFNCVPPDFRQVQQLVAQQRDELDRTAPGSARPTADPKTPPPAGEASP